MPCRIYKLDFQEKNLNLDRDLNFPSIIYQEIQLPYNILQNPKQKVISWAQI